MDSSWLAGGIAGEVRIEHENLDFVPTGVSFLVGVGTESNNSNQPGFGLPAFSSTHSASCVVQKAIRTLVWTALIRR
jgi:hypothetical protein